MSASPDDELIEGVAADLGVDPAFVEKDWHAMRLIAVLARVNHPGVIPVFAGGTSLSKGYGLIKRFSEDLDFKLQCPAGVMKRMERREYRAQIVAAIRGNEAWSVPAEDIKSRNESRYFSCSVHYHSAFERTQALRPHLKLEVSFIPPAFQTTACALRSFVAQAQRDDPEVASIECISPTETAAEKLSALSWRVLARDRDSPQDDPTLIRHLHDLAAIEGQIAIGADFTSLVSRLLDEDASRGRLWRDNPAMSGQERVSAALNRLAQDPEYHREYQRFVTGMSYAANAEIPGYQQALQSVHRLLATL